MLKVILNFFARTVIAGKNKRYILYMIDFKDAKTGLSSINAIAKRSHEKYDKVKEELNAQDGYQVNKQINQVHYFPILGKGPGSWQIDLMFVDAYKGVGTILCCINVNTRYAYSYSFKSKSDTYMYIEQFIEDAKKDDRKIAYVQSDRGSEFNNAKVKSIFDKHNIPLSFVNTADHTAQGMVERFNQSLRRLITLYISSNNNNDWVSALPDLMYNYNHRINRNLGTTPIEANEQTDLFRKFKQYRLAKADFDKLQVGDEVRILKNKEVFDKGRNEWSTKTYKIDKIDGIYFDVDGKEYKYYKLQKVVGNSIPDNFENVIKEQKKVKKITKALNKEGILHNGDVVQFQTKTRSGNPNNAIKWDASLIGRKVKKGKREGEITKYDEEGMYKWFVEFSNGDSEYMSKNELLKYLVK